MMMLNQEITLTRVEVKLNHKYTKATAKCHTHKKQQPTKLNSFHYSKSVVVSRNSYMLCDGEKRWWQNKNNNKKRPCAAEKTNSNRFALVNKKMQTKCKTLRSFTLDTKWIINDAVMTLMKYFYRHYLKNVFVISSGCLSTHGMLAISLFIDS